MLEETVGCPAVTTASAVAAIFRACGAVRLALLTPYPEEMTLAKIDYLEKAVSGLKVVSHRSMEMATGLGIGDLEPTVAYRVSRKVDVA